MCQTIAMIRRIFGLSLVLCTVLVAAGPQFEVASVKPDPWTGSGGIGFLIKGNTLLGNHVTVIDLIQFAWDVKESHVSGPSWIQNGKLTERETFQVVAKAPGETPVSRAALRLMLQALLAERFQLRVNLAIKSVPIWNLVIAKSGSKLRESAPDAPYELFINGGKPSRLSAVHVSIEQLIMSIQFHTGRPVFDKTQLGGTFDFELEYDTQGLSAAGPDSPGDETTGNSIFVSLQKQLGLKLESGTAPMNTVTVEHVERPSAN